MVGYPGETEQEFQELLGFVEDIKFDRLGVFTYSKEENTGAWLLDDDVPQNIKHERSDLIMTRQADILEQKNAALIGTYQTVSVDGFSENQNSYIGRTAFDAPDIDNKVLIRNSVEIGKYYNVLIKGTAVFDLVGQPINDV